MQALVEVFGEGLYTELDFRNEAGRIEGHKETTNISRLVYAVLFLPYITLSLCLVSHVKSFAPCKGWDKFLRRVI